MKIQDPAAFHHLNISRSGLSAQRRRMDAISENLANVHTTRGADGGPFQPRVVVLNEGREEQAFVDAESTRPKRLSVRRGWRDPACPPHGAPGAWRSGS